jgi:hypothetical protein
MKNLMKSTLILGLLVFAVACGKKETVNPAVGFTAAVQKVAPQATIDALRKLGMTINEGTVPPNVTGIFLESPTILFATYSGDTKKIGDKVADYTYKFYEPSADNTTIKVSYKTSIGDNATGLGSVVAGNGNKFTIFSELTTTTGEIYINIISGEITSNGIKDWQDSYVKKTELEKNRIYKDGDGFSESKTSFRLAASENDNMEIISSSKGDN